MDNELEQIKKDLLNMEERWSKVLETNPDPSIAPDLTNLSTDDINQKIQEARTHFNALLNPETAKPNPLLTPDRRKSLLKVMLDPQNGLPSTISIFEEACGVADQIAAEQGYYNHNHTRALAQKLKEKGFTKLIVTDGSCAYTNEKGAINEGLKNQISRTMVGGFQFCLDQLTEEEAAQTAVLLIANSDHSNKVIYNATYTRLDEKERIDNALSQSREHFGEDRVFCITFNRQTGAEVLNEITKANKYLEIESYFKWGWGSHVERSFVSLPQIKRNVSLCFLGQEEPANWDGGVWKNQGDNPEQQYPNREKIALDRLESFRKECPEIVMPSAEVAARIENGMPVENGLIGAIETCLYRMELAPNGQHYLGKNDELQFKGEFSDTPDIGLDI